MPRDGSGVYSRPVGTDAVTDTTIESTKYNVNVADVEQDLNQPRPIVAGGTGGSSATQALFNLSGETAANVVPNWDSELWTPGSFYAPTSATGTAPVAGHAFAGICYLNEALANPPTNQNLVLEATDLVNPTYPVQYIRVMTAGVWGAWKQIGGTPAAGTLGEFIFNSSTTFPPASGEIRFNNATQNSTTELFISHLTATSVDITSLIATLFVPGFDIIVQDKANTFVTGVTTPSNYKVFTATSGLTTSGSDFRILVTFKSGGANLVSTNRMLVSTPGNSTVRYDVPQNLTTGQQTQGRQNIYAAPFDNALAYSGMQINGSMELSQEKGSNGSTSGYICDGWVLSKSGTMAITGAQGILPGFFPGIPYQSNITVQTAQATLSGTDGAGIYSAIEGCRIARLGWGTTLAQPITIGFWTGHHRTGTYSVAVRNSAQNRSCVALYTQNIADASEYKTVTFPGDVTGTWNFDITVGLYLVFTMASGSTNTTSTIGSWIAGAFGAGTGQVNAVASTSDVFRISGIVVLPGIEAPSAARSALIMRPFDQELLLCQRYFWQAPSGFSFSGYAMTAGAAGGVLRYPVPMRTTPTITFPSVNANYVVAFGITASISNNPPGGTGNVPAMNISAGVQFNLPAVLTVGQGVTLFLSGAVINCDARL